MPETRPVRLSDSDALMWRIEGDPVLRSPILVVALLDRAPAWPRVQEAVRHAADAIPHWRDRLDPGGFATRPRWVEDPAFSLEHHLRRVRASAGADLRAVLEIAEPDVMTAFDPARPLWQMTLVEGLEDGKAAFILRFHHTITDGVGAIELAEHLFDAARRPRRTPPAAPGPSAPVPEPSNGAVSPSRVVSGAVTAAARAGLDPIGTVSGAVRAARSVAKILAPARQPLSPLFVGRGLDRRLHVLEMPLAGLRAAAHATGGTVNDVLLAAVGGGLRAYHEELGSSLDAVRVTMPINLRKEADSPGGNRFTPARFVLPIDDPNPAKRARVAGAIVRSWRSEPAVALTPVLAWALDLLPTPIVQQAFAGMLRSIDVDAVDVPGLTRPTFLAGARVERLWAFAPPVGAALSITLVSHVDVACVGIASDLAAVTDPGRLAACMDRAFDEVLAITGDDWASEVSA